IFQGSTSLDTLFQNAQAKAGKAVDFVLEFLGWDAASIVHILMSKVGKGAGVVYQIIESLIDAAGGGDLSAALPKALEGFETTINEVLTEFGVQNAAFSFKDLSGDMWKDMSAALVQEAVLSFVPKLLLEIGLLLFPTAL